MHWSADSIFSDEYNHEDRWVQKFFDSFAKEISQPVSDKDDVYIATQLVAEYIKSIGYDGIVYSNSLTVGKCYAFFYGPVIDKNIEHYSRIDSLTKRLLKEKEFTKLFKINGCYIKKPKETSNEK